MRENWDLTHSRFDITVGGQCIIYVFWLFDFWSRSLKWIDSVLNYNYDKNVKWHCLTGEMHLNMSNVISLTKKISLTWYTITP